MKYYRYNHNEVLPIQLEMIDDLDRWSMEDSINVSMMMMMAIVVGWLDVWIGWWCLSLDHYYYYYYYCRSEVSQNKIKLFEIIMNESRIVWVELQTSGKNSEKGACQRKYKNDVNFAQMNWSDWSKARKILSEKILLTFCLGFLRSSDLKICNLSISRRSFQLWWWWFDDDDAIFSCFKRIKYIVLIFR